MIYVESYDMPETGTLYAFNTSCRSSCQPLWSFPIGGFRSSVVVANGVIYVGTGDANNNGRLLAFDATCASDCLPFWSFTIGGNINPPIAIANGVIYVGSSYTSNGGPHGDGKLYALGLPAS